MHDELCSLNIVFPENSTTQQKASLLLRTLQHTTLAAKIKREVKDEIIKSKYSGSSLGQSLPRLMDEMGSTTRLMNLIAELKAIAEANCERGCVRDAAAATNGTGPSKLRAGYSSGGETAVLPPYPPHDDVLDTVAVARRTWRARMLERLQEHAAVHDLPFARMRTARTELARHVREAAAARPTSPSTCNTAELESRSAEQPTGSKAAPVTEKDDRQTQACPGRVRPQESLPFTASSFYRHILSLSSANNANSAGGSAAKVHGWGNIHLELSLPTPEQVCEKFAELQLSQRHLGADEGLRDRFAEERLRALQALLKKGSIADLRGYAKRGIPVSMRATVWRSFLGPFTQHDPAAGDKVRNALFVLTHDGPSHVPQRMAYLHLLQADVSKVELLVDIFVRSDIRQCADDAKYFVFDDTLERVLLPLVFPVFNSILPQRDTLLSYTRHTHQIRDPYCFPYAASSLTPLSGCDRRGTPVMDSYPPSGIIPHERLAALCAPLCYLYTDVADIYYTFRAMYCRYWIHLSSLSSRTEGILSQCKLFERLVQTYNPDVIYHCVSLGVKPLDIAFPWLYSAFSGYLEVDQLLHLWDRILAYDSLLLLPLLAAAIFLWRGRAILACETAAEVRSLFSAYSKLLVIPLLQYFVHA